MGSTTLILGGGVGGIVTANTLRAMLPSDHKVVLISKTRTFHMGATKTWVMLGERRPRQVTRSLDALKRRKIEVRNAGVQRIDPGKIEAVSDAGTIKGDFMVIALGTDLNMSAIEGLESAAHTFYTMEGALKLREALRDFKSGDLVILNPRMPIKCPPAPYEAAMLIHNNFKMRGILPRTRISVHTIEPAPMPTAGPAMGQLVSAALAERNIALHRQRRVKSVDDGKRCIHFDDGSEVHYDLLIAVPPHEPPRAVRESNLTGPGGWIVVDPKTLKMSVDRAFAIGDVTSVPLPGRFRPDAPLVLPKAAVFADSHGRVVAAHVAAHILGKDPKELFDGTGFCYLEMGDRHAIAGEGSFFELPHPRVLTRAPDMMQYEEKQKWIENWMETNL